MRLALAASLLLLFASPVAAQVCETNCQVRQGQRVVAFIEADADTPTYALYINGARQSVAPAINAGLVEFTFPNGLAVGTFTFVIRGTTHDGTSWDSEPNTLTVVRRKVKFK